MQTYIHGRYFLNLRQKRNFAGFLLVGIILWANGLASLAADDYARGMQAFNSRDYKTADAAFSLASRMSADKAPSALYMDALCLQYLGNSAKATLMFKTVCDRYPDSAACVRAQTALARLDPKYLKRFQDSHPAPSHGKLFAFGFDTSAQVSPSFTFGTRQVKAADGKVLLNFLNSGQPIPATVNQVPTDIQLVRNQANSYVGLNWLNASGVKHHAKAGGLYTGDVVFQGVQVPTFPFRVKAVLNGPVQVGKDFQDSFTYVIGMSDPNYSHRWQLAAATHKKEEAILNKGKSDTTSKGQADSAEPEEKGPQAFDIGYRKDEQKNMYVTVYVDGSPVEMLFAQSGITTFSPDQLRAVAAGYVPADSELKQETISTGMQIRDSATVTLNSIRLGKITKIKWPARMEAFSSVRYQAPISYNQNPPRLGSDVYAEWSVQEDEPHHLLHFTKGGAPR